MMRNGCRDSAAKRKGLDQSVAAQEAARCASSGLHPATLVSIDRRSLDELIRAERFEIPEEFIESALDILCRKIGAASAVAAMHPPFEVRTCMLVPVRLDASLAGSFLSESCATCECTGSDLPSLVPIEQDRGLEGTLLCGLLRQSGLVASLVYPLVTNDRERIGCVRFLFTSLCAPPDHEILAVQYVLGRLMLTLERIWSKQRSETMSAQLRAVFDGALDAMLLLNDNDVVLSANPATHQMFGYSSGSIVGSSVDRLLPEFAREDFARTRRVDDGLLREVEGVRRDRTRFQGECSVGRIEPGGTRVLVVRDVSDRRLAENRLREADRLAMIGTLAAGLGHDMNNVLFPIRAHINALERLGLRASANQRRSHIVELRGGVCYLQHLADALHYLAMDPEAESNDLASTDVGLWWTQAGPLLSKSLHRAATLEVVIEPGLPPIATPAHALTRAMLNLLVNAREAMPTARSPRDCVVSIEARRGNSPGHVRIEVRDNGVGMSPETRRRALELFFTTKVRGLGTGLGLPLVRGVVERAGGTLEIDSVPTVGTTIAMTFPATSAAREDSAPRALVRGLDGRTAAIVAALLAKRGIDVATEAPPSDCAICIVGSGTVDARVLGLWARERPAGQIIVVGAQPSSSLPVGTTLVRDPRDISEIECAIDVALGASAEVEHGGQSNDAPSLNESH